MVVTRAGRLREWSQAELRLYPFWSEDPRIDHKAEKCPIYEKITSRLLRSLRPSFQIWREKRTAREHRREHCKLSFLSSPLVHAAPFVCGFAWLLATPSNGELARKLRRGYDYRRGDRSLSVGNFSSTLRFITNRRPTNLPNSSLDLVALSSYNFICLKMRNHIIFNSYLCRSPPSTHSWRKNRKDTIQIRTNNFSSTPLTHSFYKNHFKKNVQSEIYQKTKNQEKKSRTC